jgi:hypothetical protein
MTIKLELSFTFKNCEVTLSNRDRKEVCEVLCLQLRQTGTFLYRRANKTESDVNLDNETLHKDNLVSGQDFKSTGTNF